MKQDFEQQAADDEPPLDITPATKILLALTRTQLAPLDALCELIDNGVDSFHEALLNGQPVAHPLVHVTLPGAAEVARGEGIVRVQDNGRGLDRDQLANTLKAGYTSKNPFDTLGLFGMGFNIATGKLGRRTRLTTCRSEDPTALEVTLDLVELGRTGEFKVPVRRISKPPHFDHGTVVEVFSWWPEGDPNSGFIRKLASMSKVFVRQQLGRRYGTLLRRPDADQVRLLVNDVPCQPFEHCVWGPDRFVERQGWGRIAAYAPIDETIHTSRRCSDDGTVIDGDATLCPECGRSDFQVVTERMRGWVGVQRFDDASEFGVDLIRNGRAIRVGEKQAFFTYVDEDTKKEEKEYPVDQIYGRIVGEVHLDHVPVDFQKQDFQRSSDEWRRAMEHLRGGSLTPSRWADSDKNSSPISRLFQGYRKVRNFGRGDMYMGAYNAASGKAERIDRAVEREYYAKFLGRLHGYYTDENWWELVETANIPPIIQLPECPKCGFQNLESQEICDQCGHILRGKTCAACGEVIAGSATTCLHCGTSQVPDVREPWRCNVCEETNDTDAELCVRCSAVRGAPNPGSVGALEINSKPSEALSLQGLALAMADGSTSSSLDVHVRIADSPLQPIWQGTALPTVSFRQPGVITMFLDMTHRMFRDLGARPQDVVAYESAQYFYDLYSHLIGRKAHSLPALAQQILFSRWEDELSETPEGVRAGVADLFASVGEALLGSPRAGDFYGELDEQEQTALAQGMIAAGIDISQADGLRTSGGYLRYVSPGTLVNFFRIYPAAWFGGQVWSEALPTEELGEVVARGMREELVTKYIRCLEDCASYLRYQRPERLIVIRARASLDYLEAHLR